MRTHWEAVHAAVGTNTVFGPINTETSRHSSGLKPPQATRANAFRVRILRELERFDCLTNFEDGRPVNQCAVIELVDRV